MRGIKKADVANLSYKDVAYLILEKRKRGLNTLDLFKLIAELLNIPENIIDQKIGDFYTSLMTDQRFAMIDGLWDLREHHTSDKVIHKIADDDEEVVDVEEEANDYDDETEEDEESFDNENNDDDYDSDDDDLADLVVIDEDEMEEDIN